MQNGGFSSYQAEFPHRMSQINGSMVSSAGNLINLENSSNLVFVRNIYHEPILSKFDLYIWDEDDDAPLERKFLSTNSTNVVILDSYLENISRAMSVFSQMGSYVYLFFYLTLVMVK